MGFAHLDQFSRVGMELEGVQFRQLLIGHDWEKKDEHICVYGCVSIGTDHIAFLFGSVWGQCGVPTLAKKKPICEVGQGGFRYPRSESVVLIAHRPHSISWHPVCANG